MSDALELALVDDALGEQGSAQIDEAELRPDRVWPARPPLFDKHISALRAGFDTRTLAEPACAGNAGGGGLI